MEGASKGACQGYPDSPYIPYPVGSQLELLRVLEFHWLVVWDISFIFAYTGNVIIPIDELIFLRGVGIPPTSHIVDSTLWSTNNVLLKLAEHDS